MRVLGALDVAVEQRALGSRRVQVRRPFAPALGEVLPRGGIGALERALEAGTVVSRTAAVSLPSSRGTIIARDHARFTGAAARERCESTISPGTFSAPASNMRRGSCVAMLAQCRLATRGAVHAGAIEAARDAVTPDDSWNDVP